MINYSKEELESCSIKKLRDILIEVGVGGVDYWEIYAMYNNKIREEAHDQVARTVEY